MANPTDIYIKKIPDHIKKIEKEKERLQAEVNKLRDEVFALSAQTHAAMNIVAKADQIMLDAVSWYDNYQGTIDHCAWIEAARDHVKFYKDNRTV